MKNHTKIYFDALGKYPDEGTECEMCDRPATDIHHIERRGMGGTTNPESNSIFNLMALCRQCHEDYGDKVKYKRLLKLKHLRLITQRGARLLGIYQEVNFNHNKIIFEGEIE